LKSNPFATRFVRPGEIAWVATGHDDSLTALADSFQTRFRRRAAIVGPHGSGKSTLLEHLIPLLNGEKVLLKLRRSEQPFKKIRASTPQWSRGALLVLDGFEQLSTWQAIRVCWMVRQRRMGLLVTCHQPSWLLPTLLRLAPTAELVQRLVTERLAESHARSPLDRSEWIEEMTDAQRLKRWLTEERGSVREVFMRLYDSYEDRHNSASLPATRESD
jgi:energy-coupling factor transporter ATP-binding protein EcfA2